jgi:predicted RNase H-like nuclease (RuvC/YqgF family)
MTKKEVSFKGAFERLKEIELELQKDDIIDVDNLIELQKEAKELYKIADNKLKVLEK